MVATIPFTMIPSLERICNIPLDDTDLSAWVETYDSPDMRKDRVIISSCDGQPLVTGILDGIRSAILNSSDRVKYQDIGSILKFLQYLASNVKNGLPNEAMLERIMARVTEYHAQSLESDVVPDSVKGLASQEVKDKFYKGGVYYPGFPPLQPRGKYFKDVKSKSKTPAAGSSAKSIKGCTKSFRSKTYRTGDVVAHPSPVHTFFSALIRLPLAGGIFTFMCVHGVCLGHHVIPSSEGMCLKVPLPAMVADPRMERDQDQFKSY